MTGTTAIRTVLRVAGWSLAATCVAAIALRFTGNGQTFARTLPVCGMLLLILLVTSSAAARLERFLGKSRNAECSRETAGRTTTIALALLGALPLWLGPAAELLASREPWLVDALIGASPLTHLAVASGNDLLRNPWFYQHANLAALRFSYPGLTEIALLYGTLAVTLALVSLVPAKLRLARGGVRLLPALKEPVS